ncbi:probable anion transporter 3, chloroplastic [Selaginella moellendorffii]|nr:probable anion transporter 3, chloroplastic [Selaginella moellendorffii]XP_024527673.1 probable anion transporter 3, chloroplastic [Selaginella moellendorffii]|eukprot:XP_002966917.2 probable anion transporter 3, chloroplastic [Selaginella moellendorffii]
MECAKAAHAGFLGARLGGIGSKQFLAAPGVYSLRRRKRLATGARHIDSSSGNSSRNVRAGTATRENFLSQAQVISSEESLDFTDPSSAALAAREWAVSTAPGLSLLSSERIKVAAMLAFGMGLCNAVRVIMSVAIVPLSATHNWSSGFAGIIQSSFLWGYLLSPIPGGALADRFGGKSVMGWGVFFWSIATLITPWAASRSLGLLLAVRVFMGLAEGVAMPSMNNMVSRWFPSSERAKAVAIAMGGFHLGNVSGLLLTPILMSRFGIDGPFYAFGTVGLAWLSLWYMHISKDPQNHGTITRNELLFIQNGTDKRKVTARVGMPPFRLLLSKLPSWAIIAANAMNNWGYFIILTWMPVYFNRVLGVNLKQAAWFSAVPWATMAASGYFAGAWSDLMISSGMRALTVRKIMQSIGFLGPAVALIGLNSTRHPAIASTWLTIAVALSAFSQAGYLVNYQEIAPSYAGVLHGLSNTAGTFAAIVSTVGTGYLVQWLGSFQAVLLLTSGMYIVSTLFWNSCATGEKIFD